MAKEEAYTILAASKADMQRFLLIILFIGGFFSSHILSAQTNEPSHILGYTWGTPYKTCLKNLKDSKVKTAGEKEIEIIYKENGFEIKLVFDNGLYEVSKMKTFPIGNGDKAMEEFNKMLEELVELHGNYKKPKVQEKEVLVFEWTFSKTLMSLIYFIPTNSITLSYSKI